MQQEASKYGKGTNLFLGIFLIVTGLVLMVSHFMFPVVGMIVGVPCLAAGIFFVVKHQRSITESEPPLNERQ